MRLASLERPRRGPLGAVLVDEQLVPTSALGAPASVRGVLRALDPDGLRELGARAAETLSAPTREPPSVPTRHAVADPLRDPLADPVPLAGAALAAPVPDPQKIICIGLNYRDHARETGQEIPAAPMWFAKFQNSLIGSGQPIVLPAAHPDYVDYEAELALVIGLRARNVAVENALSHIAGAMPFNDVSARDLQMQNSLWTSGKAIDTFAPCGPALVTLDEIGDLAGLTLRTRIGGETLQEGTTDDLIFGPAELVAWLSRTITLEPGDIIATGTPAGVGAAHGRFLRDGDVVEVEIDGLGALANPVRSE